MYGYKVTIEDKGAKKKYVFDDLDGLIVATADSQGGNGLFASDFRYHQATYEMVAFAKVIVENCLQMIHDDFMSFASTPEAGEQRYWRVLQEVSKTMEAIKSESLREDKNENKN